MARLPRLEVAAWPHLVAQRVHDGQLLARDDADRTLLLQIWREAARVHRVNIHAYCLAPDHFHLLLTPEQGTSLSLFMQAVGRRYVSAYNRRHSRQGGLWAGRYRATVLDPTQYLLDAMVWIETHGHRAGGAVPGMDDVWSSVAHHLGRCSDPLISDHAVFWSLGNTPFEREAAWRRRLEDGLSARQIQTVADATHKGWALLADAMVPEVEAAAGRRLTPRPRGRPKKVPSADHM